MNEKLKKMKQNWKEKMFKSEKEIEELKNSKVSKIFDPFLE